MTVNIVGVFVLGMFAGWLVEWLFITFIMNKSQKTSVAEADNNSVAHAVIPSNTATTEKTERVDEEKQQADVVEESKVTVHDDFLLLKGIGPKLAASIKEVNITRYEELAAFTGEELIEKLETSGAIIVNRPAFIHIPKQAALAAKEDWDGLETLKKSI